MRRTTMTTEKGAWLVVTMVTLCGFNLVLPEAVQAEESMVASLHPVDAPTGRVSDRSVGKLRFTPGKAAGEVAMLVQINDLPMSGQEPLMAEGEHAIYRHGLQVRATGDCSDTKLGGAGAINLPNVDLRNSGTAEMTTTAKGITLSALAGKSVALFVGTDPAKGKVVACGVIKKGDS